MAVVGVAVASHHASIGTQENVIFSADGRNALGDEEVHLEGLYHFCRGGYHIYPRLVCHHACRFVCHALYLGWLWVGWEAGALREAVCPCIHLKAAGDLSP